MTIREQTERIERETLSRYAALAENSRGRVSPEPQDELRTVYQRDRDRIIHSKSFRRLMNKTQVFLSPEGDHYRTRLTHTLEVSQIARTIARALRLNEDLTEAIALSHDLGHTPFGHAGERALNKLVPGGFRHYEHSVRVVEKLEKNGRGLNLTAEVKDGILCHTSGKEAFTMEGRIIRWADKIAYINHDIDDAISAGCIKEEDIPKEITDVLGHSKTERITTLICSIITNTVDDVIKMDEATYEAYINLHNYMYQSVYLNDYAKKEEKKVPNLIGTLFEHFMDVDNLPSNLRMIAEEDGCEKAAADYIAGMTDRYAVEYYENLFVPKAWNIGL